MKVRLNNTELVFGKFVIPSQFVQNVNVVANTASGNNNYFYSSSTISGMTKIAFYLEDKNGCVSSYAVKSTNGKDIKNELTLLPNKLYTLTRDEINPEFLSASASMFGCYISAARALSSGTVKFSMDITK